MQNTETQAIVFLQKISYTKSMEGMSPDGRLHLAGELRQSGPGAGEKVLKRKS